MRQTLSKLGIGALLALAFWAPSVPATAEPVLIQFQGGVLCDKSSQIEEIVKQFRQVPLKNVLKALNARTGKVSCGVVRRPIFFLMEPQKIVSTPGGKMIIMKLTARSGQVQYAWRQMVKSKPQGQMV